MPVGTPPFYQDAPDGLAERRWPTRADLDAAAPDHPVYIRGIWGYWNRPPVYSVANSRALALAGVTRDTAPPHGRGDREGRRRPADRRVRRAQSDPGARVHPDARGAALHARRPPARARVSQRRYAARGVTAVYEGHGIAPEVLAVYRESHARGELRLRCTLAVSPTWDAAEAARAMPDLAAWAGGRGLGDDRLRVGGICLHYGGDAEVARILHAGQPYTGWAGFVESANAPAAYVAQAELAARHGLRVNTLVTRCLPEVLDVWEAMARRHPIRDLRWVLVHLNAATPEQLARIRRLGAVATTNPISYLYRSAGDEVAQARRRRRPAPAPPEPRPSAHPVRHRHRQQAGRSVGRLRGGRGPPRHAHGHRRGPSASGSRAPRRSPRSRGAAPGSRSPSASAAGWPRAGPPTSRCSSTIR